jgi:hypothetical protein
MTDDTADNRSTDGPDTTAAGKNCPANGAGTGTNGRIPVLPRHAGTRCQTWQACCDDDSQREFLHRSHGITSCKR